jgi:hypothetical protein
LNPFAQDLTSSESDRPPPQFLALRRVLQTVGLDGLTSIHLAATALVVLILASEWFSPPSSFQFFLFVLAAGLIATQVMAATVWATWSFQPLLSRLGHWAWRMALLYLLLLLIDLGLGRRHTAMLWSIPVCVALLTIGAWLPAWIFRWFRWRLSNASDATSAVGPSQFHLADLFRWCTLLSILLAVMILFRAELSGWDGLGYFIAMYCSLLACGPAGLVVMLLLWLALGERWTTTRRVLASLLVLAWLTVCVIWSVSETNQTWFGQEWAFIALFTTTLSAATLLIAAALRRQGWRVVRA